MSPLCSVVRKKTPVCCIHGTLDLGVAIDQAPTKYDPILHMLPSSELCVVLYGNLVRTFGIHSTTLHTTKDACKLGMVVYVLDRWNQYFTLLQDISSLLFIFLVKIYCIFSAQPKPADLTMANTTTTTIDPSVLHVATALLELRKEDDMMSSKRALRAGEYIHKPDPPAAHFPPSTNPPPYLRLDATSPDTVLASVLLIDLTKQDAKQSAKRETKTTKPEPKPKSTTTPPARSPGSYFIPLHSRLRLESSFPDSNYPDIEYQVPHSRAPAPAMTERLPRVYMHKIFPAAVKGSHKARGLLKQAMQFSHFALSNPASQPSWTGSAGKQVSMP
jgi:hypothetical protein